jgi:hypothetical protein
MTTSKIDIAAGLAYIAGPSTLGLVSAFGEAWPTYGKIAAFVGGSLVLSAGLILRMFFNQTNAPATSVVAGAPIVTPTVQASNVAAKIAASPAAVGASVNGIAQQQVSDIGTQPIPT